MTLFEIIILEVNTILSDIGKVYSGYLTPYCLKTEGKEEVMWMYLYEKL